jgi:Transposase DDE domain
MGPRKRAAKQARRQQMRFPTNSESLRKLLHWLLPNDGIFSTLSFHGNSKWKPTYLVVLALCWAWSDVRQLTDAFADAVDTCQKLYNCVAVTTYQGFMRAIVTWTPRILPLVRSLLQQRMEQLASRFWRLEGWVPIGFDGSRSSAPRTQANEAAFCAGNYGKGKTARYRKKKSKGMRREKNEKNKPQPQKPQAWITMMWHMGLRLPWSWRLGPSNSSERDHVMDMVRTETFPKKTLFCGDAGFIGYPLWSCLVERGHDFLVRVGANVHLLTREDGFTLEKEGKEYSVLCWPETAIVNNLPPLHLRLLRVCLGKIKVWMLTNVLDPNRLTGAAIAGIYKMRWGIEVEFRGLKQTLDRAKLRSRNDKRLLVELDWSILAMAVAELLALKEQQAPRSAGCSDQRMPVDPVKRSLANAMRALRRCLRNINDVPQPGQDLASQLRAAVTDSYQRKGPKQARYRPPNPDKKPLGDPNVRPLEPHERRKLEHWDAQMAA